MSPLKLSNDPTTPQYRKPRADVYTVLLVVALLALIAGILCLWGETAAYEWQEFQGRRRRSRRRPARPRAGDAVRHVRDLQRLAMDYANLHFCVSHTLNPDREHGCSSVCLTRLTRRPGGRSGHRQHAGRRGRRGLVVDEPSVVAVEQGTRRILARCAVGHLAQQMEGRTPGSIAVVRPLGDGVIADFELCEAMLRYFLGKAQRPGLRLPPRVLVGVPRRSRPSKAGRLQQRRAGRRAAVWR